MSYKGHKPGITSASVLRTVASNPEIRLDRTISLNVRPMIAGMLQRQRRASEPDSTIVRRLISDDLWRCPRGDLRDRGVLLFTPAREVGDYRECRIRLTEEMYGVFNARVYALAVKREHYLTALVCRADVLLDGGIVVPDDPEHTCWWSYREGSVDQSIRVMRQAYGPKVITFHRSLATVAGNANGGLFLSQAMYLMSCHNDEDGWFFHTAAQWEQDTMLTRREQETIRRHLCEIGVLEEDRRGIPSKLYFRVNEERLRDLLAGDTEDTSPLNQIGGKRQTRLAENAITDRRKAPISNKEDRVRVEEDPISPPGGGEQEIPSPSDSPAILDEPPPPAVPKPSKADRDAIWDAYVEGTGLSPVTAADRSNLGGIVKATLEAKLTPKQVLAACDEYRRAWGEEVTITWRGVYNNITVLLRDRHARKQRERARGQQPIV
jgi:hypothetical protein